MEPLAKILIEWNLQAIWESGASNNIVFTSINDNSVWESLWSWAPSTWDWQNIEFSDSWSDNSTLDYVQAKYHWNTNTYWIYFYYSDATIRNSFVYSWWWDWIFSAESSPTIEYNTILDNTKNGINSLGWTPIINNNSVTNNWNRWIDSRYANSTISGNTVIGNAFPIIAPNLEPFLPSYNNIITWNSFNTFFAFNFAIDSTSWYLDNPNGDITVTDWGALWSWQTLTINEWNIVKIAQTAYVIRIEWNLQAVWTAWTGNITFTSTNDNSVWESLWSWSPVAWDWIGIEFQDAWSNNSILDYTKLKYYGSGNNPWVYFNSSNATVTNSIISNWLAHWIASISSSPTISNNTVSNNWWYWIASNLSNIVISLVI